jgi:hypothetical protein
VCDPLEEVGLPSPKVHVVLNGAAPEDVLVKVTDPGGLQIAVGLPEKLATGGLNTVMYAVLVIVLVQPCALVADSVTLYEPGVP